MRTNATTTDTRRSFPLLGAVATPVVVGDDTGHAWEAVELALTERAASPLHTLGTDKLFYVAAGSVTVTLDGADRVVGAGGFVHVPAGTAHRYRNESGAPARMLVVTTGRGQVEFLAGMSRLTADGPPDPAAVAEHTTRFGVTILAPPA